MAQLDIQHVRELEDLLISECFYAGLLKGKLDQKDRCLHVQESIARDVKKEEISFLVDGLGSWWALPRWWSYKLHMTCNASKFQLEVFPSGIEELKETG